MNKNKIIFSTYCQDEVQSRWGMNKLVNSFKYYHPDYEIIVYGTSEINRVLKEYNAHWQTRLHYIMLDMIRKYDTEYICHLDADSLVLGRLDKILSCDYEIASCTNNCDIGDADERQNRPKELWGLPNSKYVSCGCLATNSEKFILQWIGMIENVIKTYGEINTFWMCDQNWMNVLFHYGGFKSKILDPLDGDVFYGASANMNLKHLDRKDPEHIIKEWNINTWRTWADIEYKNGGFLLYGKQVKLLHQAGGGRAETAKKLSFDLFNNPVKIKLIEITKHNE